MPMKEPNEKDIFGEVSIMKRFVCLVFCVLLVASFLESSYVGKVYFKQQPGEQHMKVFRVPKDFYESWTFRDRTSGKDGIGRRTDQETIRTFEDQLSLLQAYFESEIQKGNLRLRLVQDDPEAMMEHHRYTQYYKDLEVFGGEIIRHFKQGQLVGINGEYYEIKDFDTFPLITKDMAVGLFKADLGKSNLVEKEKESKLIIYPIKDEDYHLAYKAILAEGIAYSMTGIIDAKTGEILLKYSNIKDEAITVGLGIGYHGMKYKLPTTYSNNIYWLADEKDVRSVTQYTRDLGNWDWNVWDIIYNIEKYIAFDLDNYWDFDAALVSVHAFLGMTYDYYYQFIGRKGIDDNNLNIVANVHSPLDPDNACWRGEGVKQMFFGDPLYGEMQTAAGLDVVAHEYSHGVTEFTSRLEYYCDLYHQPGALNESFSDIMGTAVELFWQDRGNGFNKADWVFGEDTYPNYSSNSYFRSLADPNSKRDTFYGISYRHPCHLSQYHIFPNTEEGDSGGVHFNSTLYSHAYYLLSEGGTNGVSHISVSGIGVEKATRIFYRAWVDYMKKETASFLDAANALLQSANDLYESSSNEYAQTVRAMEAIGWIVN
jgi:Zn-dependent metalloprotease